MQEKLEKLYTECIKELKTIGINILDNKEVGSIDIKISNRATKRYGCCKQEKPNKKYYHRIRVGRRMIIKYDVFHEHHIDISKWVMDLDEKVIKNTIIHELIHCLPYCNDHGKMFKQYAGLINEKLGYEITRVGNKKKDYEDSNLNYAEDSKDQKHKIVCRDCGQVYFRQRLKKDLAKKYRCSKCGGKLLIEY